MHLTRREFIRTGAWGAAGALSLLQMQARGEVNIKISACDWSMDVTNQPEGLDVAKEIGLDGLEISAAAGAADVLKIADPEYRQAYKDAVQRTGLAISSTALGLLNDYPLASDERAPVWLEQTIHGTADLGVKVILLAFFGKGDLLDKKSLLGGGGELKTAELDVVVERLRAAAPLAEKAGVIFGVENTLSAAQNLAILERVQSNAVLVYYDIGNSTYNGYDVPAEIRALNDRICQIHFKDGGFALGKGRVDMDAVAAAMRDIRYEGWVTLETAIRNRDRDASFRANAEFTRGLFGMA